MLTEGVSALQSRWQGVPDRKKETEKETASGTCVSGLAADRRWIGGSTTAVGGHEEQGLGKDALEGKGPRRRPQKRLAGRLEEVAKAVGGGYCRLQTPLKPALGVRGTVAGHRLGALKGGGGGTPPSNSFLGWGVFKGKKPS